MSPTVVNALKRFPEAQVFIRECFGVSKGASVETIAKYIRTFQVSGIQTHFSWRATLKGSDAEREYTYGRGISERDAVEDLLRKLWRRT